MNFADWQNLSPADAARRLHRRAVTRLSPAQQRAALARVLPEEKLAEAFATARSSTGPLAGVPYLAKDLFDVANLPTLAGSTFLPRCARRPPVTGPSCVPWARPAPCSREKPTSTNLPTASPARTPTTATVRIPFFPAAPPVVPAAVLSPPWPPASCPSRSAATPGFRARARRLVRTLRFSPHRA